MYLKRIELQGFKSFAGKTVLEFHKGITSVVGPNGSGKSNIADAVRWVLGEQSARQLRGSKMFDVIFSGTQFRKSVGFAEVTLVVDNSEGRLPVEYTEVSISRRLYRSGESDFSINGNSCRLKDIRELFYDTGVGRDGYSIISQGKIQEILSVKSEDRRGIFEEAAGIMKYKIRKLEAQRKLEKTEQNLLRIGDIVRELAKQLGPLEEQSRKAREYLELRDVLQRNEVGLYLSNLKNFNARLEKYDLDIETLKGDIENQNEALAFAAGENQERKGRLHELGLLEEDARKNLNDYLMSVETNRHEIQISIERLNSVMAGRERARRDIAETDEKSRQLSRDYYKRGERIGYLEKQKKEYEEKLAKSRAEMDAVLASLGEKEKDMEKLRETIDDSIDTLSDVKIRLRTRELDNISLEESITAANSAKQSLILEKDSYILKMQDSQNAAEKLSQNARKAAAGMETARQAIVETEKNLESLKGEAEKKRTRLGILDSSLKILDDMEKRMEGYNSSVRSIMEEVRSGDSELTGISVTAAQVLEVGTGYEKAIEAVLGNNIQSILADSGSDIETAVRYLKEKNLGRASFISGKTARPATVPAEAIEKARKCPGFCCMAEEAAVCAEGPESPVLALLADTAIADTYENARDISKATGHVLNAVSLEGDFFARSGIISGGSHTSGPTGILNREKRIKQLNDETGSLGRTLEELAVRISQSLGELEALRSSEASIRTELELINGDLIKKTSEAEAAGELLSRINGRIASTEDSLRTYAERRKKNTEETGELRIKLAETEDLIGGLRSRIAVHESSHQEDRRRRDALHMDISDLKVSYNSVIESLESTGETMGRIDSEKKELEARKELTLLEIEEFDKLENELGKKITEKQNLVVNPEKEKDRLSGVLLKLSSERKATEEEADRHIARVNGINKEILILQDKCSRIEINRATTMSEIEAMKNRMWDEYGLTHNEALARHAEIVNVGEARKEINECRRRLKDLGSVNVNAIEDYASTRERHQFLSAQQHDLESSKEDLYKIIREMNTIMKKTFTEQLEIINERFEKVFVSLFEGGKARIELVDENDVLESGIDIIVQPPGKRLQNMMLLSGGEKAFTAIALLFAILEINPSPFCIFDEIEAALDETNVWKFGEYIRNYNDTTQFIMITHRKGTMEHSDSIYGVTMQEHGISKVVSMNMTD
ncbi:MAG: chromosome segregation protein SMC [Clostridia bacterium]|nr:chromosome segregation protein SMC [Clostridia bacterium]